MDCKLRENIRPGQEVDIVLKGDQKTGLRTRGIIKALLTSAKKHSRGIKVMLQDHRVGRVVEVIKDVEKY
jgi:uncharacterized repeat protein (TIGR03833 family)